MPLSSRGAQSAVVVTFTIVGAPPIPIVFSSRGTATTTVVVAHASTIFVTVLAFLFLTCFFALFSFTDSDAIIHVFLIFVAMIYVVS